METPEPNKAKLPYLLPYQRKWMADKSDVKVYEKSRQIGVTWVEALEAVLNASKSDGLNWYYLGYEKEMTEGFINRAADHVARLELAVSEMNLPKDFLPTNKDRNVYKIRFPNGHQIATLTSEARNLRSRDKAVAVIDEAAFHEDLAGVLEAAMALTQWGGRVHVISTHYGADNAFNKLVNDIRAGRRNFSLHRTTFDDALEQGLYKIICQDQGIQWTYRGEIEWRSATFAKYGYLESAEQELLCIPSQSGGLFLPSALIESRMQDGIPIIRGRGGTADGVRIDVLDQIKAELDRALQWNIDPALRSCFGYDFGRSGDLSVIWPLQIQHNMRRMTPFIVELRNVEHEQQKDILFHIVNRLPRFFSGVCDATGNGSYLAEAAGLKYGLATKERPQLPIEALMLTQSWYIDNMPKFKAAFEDGRLAIPRDAGVHDDLQMIRMEHGIAKIPDKRTRGSDAGMRHGDSAVAAALAYYASGRGGAEYGYRPVPTAMSERRSDEKYSEDDDNYSRRGWGLGRAKFGPGSW